MGNQTKMVISLDPIAALHSHYPVDIIPLSGRPVTFRFYDIGQYTPYSTLYVAKRRFFSQFRFCMMGDRSL